MLSRCSSSLLFLLKAHGVKIIIIILTIINYIYMNKLPYLIRYRYISDQL